MQTNKNLKEMNQIEKEKISSDFHTSEPMTHKAYHELSDFPVQESDALTQLQSNIQMLENICARFAFTMREVTYILKR